MPIMHRGRAWLDATPSGEKITRKIPREVCPACGRMIAASALKAHAWGPKCEALATEKRLLEEGWVLWNNRWSIDPTEAGVEVKTGRKLMVKEWVAVLVASCRAHYIYDKSIIIHWLRVLNNNNDAQSVFMRTRHMMTVRGTRRQVGDLPFVGLLGDVDMLIALSSRTTKAGGVGYKSVAAWILAATVRLSNNVLRLTDAELHEVAIAASRAALYIEKYSTIYPGSAERGAVNYKETILVRAAKLREICHAKRDSMEHAEPATRQ